MIELKRKYKLRLFIDETVSFGTLGEHGRGITEYKNISVRDACNIFGLCMPLFPGVSLSTYDLLADERR